jgi:hypothetical protein
MPLTMSVGFRMSSVFKYDGAKVLELELFSLDNPRPWAPRPAPGGVAETGKPCWDSGRPCAGGEGAESSADEEGLMKDLGLPRPRELEDAVEAEVLLLIKGLLRTDMVRVSRGVKRGFRGPGAVRSWNLVGIWRCRGVVARDCCVGDCWDACKHSFKEMSTTDKAANPARRATRRCQSQGKSTK